MVFFLHQIKWGTIYMTSYENKMSRLQPLPEATSPGFVFKQGQIEISLYLQLPYNSSTC